MPILPMVGENIGIKLDIGQTFLFGESLQQLVAVVEEFQCWLVVIVSVRPGVGKKERIDAIGWIGLVLKMVVKGGERINATRKASTH